LELLLIVIDVRRGRGAGVFLRHPSVVTVPFTRDLLLASSVTSCCNANSERRS
jgi:hypothetical protein